MTKRKTSPEPPLEKLSYEQALTELEEIVASLEAGEDSLEASLALYERGQALAKHCSALLDHAELIVRQISENNFTATASDAPPQ